MSDLPKFLEAQYVSALEQAKNSHASNISRDLLGIFKQVAIYNPNQATQAVELLIHHIQIHRSNLIAALYCLCVLADTSREMAEIIKNKMQLEELNFYVGDTNSDISNNAQILKEIIYNATPMANFANKDSSTGNTDINIGSVIGSNLSINSSGSSQSISTQLQQPEVKQQLLELDQAIQRKDSGAILKILAWLGNKATDLFVEVIANGINNLPNS
jgi:hypothetical protein